ncbi:Ig-like domain-containing protein [Fluviicola taffensis]|uniref:Ig-like domain-containing protein n=1 Tax=Fluviicola taffensis TaxID=191579 RepID=UPI0031381257
MKKLLLLSSLVSLSYFKGFAQCDINASASATTITCGQSVNLSAFGSSTGQMVLNETFNTGGFGTGWGATPGSTNFSNPCSPAGVDGTPHAWMDNNTSVPRTLTSAPYNLTAATAGVSICFDLLFAEQGDASPCEGPDEPDEGVFLQYSIDGGATWIDIHYFDPNGGNDPQLTNWNNWCFALPPGAITANTLIRWHQIADSGADYDHWGIDNVQIFQNDINSEVEWLHDGYSYGIGNPGGVNPNAVTPTTTTTYTAQITTGTGQVCTTSITINVIPPVYDVTVSASPTTICSGDCSTITGTGQVVIDPGGLETYENNEFNVVASGSAEVNINVQGINTTTITNGLIQNVTINGFNFSGSFLCTSFGGCNCNGSNIGFGSNCNLTASGFTVTLTSPGGCDIILAPAGVASGNYNNTVFVPVGGSALGGTFPASGGPWNPNQPFSGLNGCDPNGVWTLSFNAPGLGLGFGTLQGWSITFNDPPIYAPVNYSWSPTTGLSNPTSINTQACPTSTTNYVLTVSNGTPGCPTHTENVNIIVDPCGGCIPPVVNVNPLNTCAPGTVNLSTAIAAGSAPATLTYHATQADAQNDVNPISTTVGTSGSYWVRYEDPTNSTCFGVTQIVVTINPADNPAFTLTNFCTGSTNQATGIATPGGTFSFNPLPTDGATINTSTGAISNATTGTTYTVQYTTNGTCPASTTHPVSASGFSYSASITDETCGNANGEINIAPTGGTAPYSFSINGGATQSSGIFTGLTLGVYSILITDNAGCQSTGTENVGSIGGPTIDNLQTVNPTCGTGCNGSITATVSGGTAPYTYEWFDASNNPIGTNSATISNLCGGTYSLQVTDAGGGSTQLFYDDFETGIAGWNFNMPQGPEGSDPNFFEVDDDEGGVAPGGCGIAGNGDATLHITSVFFPGGGAAYDAGGLCGILFCPQTDRQAESPAINTVGQSNLTLNFDYIAQGDIPNDQATVWYNAGAGWVQLGAALFSGTGVCSPQGIWTAYSSPLPAVCENIPNLRIAIRWQNNDDGVGTDPSVAINNLEVITASATSCPSIGFATLTSPAGGDDPSFTVSNYCEGATNSATGIVTAGGTFAFNPIPTDGATINASTGAIANGIGGTTYTVQYTTNGACPGTQTHVVTVYPIPTITGSEVCVGSTVQLTATGTPNATNPWVSSNPTIASIDNTGLVTGLTVGTVTITFTNSNGCSSTYSLNSVDSPTINGNLTICLGNTTQLTGSGTPNSSNPWVSSNPAIATVTNTGLVTGISNGVVTITYTNSGSCDNSVQVTVNPGAAINGTTNVCNGTNSILTGAGIPDAITPWTSSNTAVASIDNSGNVTSISPGTTTITYLNSGGCSSTVLFTVFDIPIVSFTSNASEGCAPQTIVFTNTGSASTNCVWTFEGIGTQNGCGSVTQLFNQEGVYDITLTVTNANGCISSLTNTDMITIHPEVDADFTVDHTQQTVLNTLFQFTNTSTGATNYTWDFDDGTYSNLTNAVHAYDEVAGVYTVMLTASNSFGCRDSATMVISVVDELYWFVPNTFTPDGDEVNNYFKPIFSPGFDVKDYSFLIFDRWGEIIFESKDMNVGWDGTYNNLISKEGIYTYKITLKERNLDKRYEIIGHVNLLK